MIGFLSGVVAGRTGEGCLLDVAGVGYGLVCSTTTLSSLPPEGRSTRLWTHLQVRDDALVLFGFATETERSMFEGLLGVAGVGPKVALQVCSGFTPEQFRRALVTDDAGAIAAVPGVGKKTAQRILLDLKEKLDLSGPAVPSGNGSVVAEARSALENLGYSPGEVRAALTRLEAEPESSVEALVRSALKELG